MIFTCYSRTVQYVHICSTQSRNRTIPELHLHKVGILTLSDKVRIPTLHGSIPELSVRNVGIGAK